METKEKINKEYQKWVDKINSEKYKVLPPSTIFSLKTMFASMRYLNKKGFKSTDYKKVHDSFLLNDFIHSLMEIDFGKKIIGEQTTH